MRQRPSWETRAAVVFQIACRVGALPLPNTNAVGRADENLGDELFARDARRDHDWRAPRSQEAAEQFEELRAFERRRLLTEDDQIRRRGQRELQRLDRRHRAGALVPEVREELP